MSNVQSRFIFVSNQIESAYNTSIFIENKMIDYFYNCDVIFLLFELNFLFFLFFFFFEPPGKNL